MFPLQGYFTNFAGRQGLVLFINYLDPERDYEVLYGPGAKLIGTWSGRELQEQGFPIVLETTATSEEQKDFPQHENSDAESNKKEIKFIPEGEYCTIPGDEIYNNYTIVCIQT